MVSLSGPLTRSAPTRVAVAGVHRGVRSRSRWIGSPAYWQVMRVPILVVAIATTNGILLTAIRVTKTALPWALLELLLVVAALFLPRRDYQRVAGVMVSGLVIVVAIAAPDDRLVLTASAAVVAGSVPLMSRLLRQRHRLGVTGGEGEFMLADLRRRLSQHGRLPMLPTGWRAEAQVKPANGDSFAGDFLVASHHADTVLEVALVDVSGKGIRAGTRALQLSGALGGLLGSVPAEAFLPMANRYLTQQDWGDAFASVVHLSIDLKSGTYSVGRAGHPPAAQLRGGSGIWRLVDSPAGPPLGVSESATFPRTSGEVRRGDALLLYTDGVVESRDRTFADGVDRMLGVAERVVSNGLEGGARRIIESSLAGDEDDRAVVLIWREVNSL